VIRALGQVNEWRGTPKRIRSDNGPEYISYLLKNWAVKNNIILGFTQSGNPQQNAYVERYNRIVRYDWLSQYVFKSMQLSGYGRTTMIDLTWLPAHNTDLKIGLSCLKKTLLLIFLRSRLK